MARKRKRHRSHTNSLYRQLIEERQRAEHYRRLLATRSRQYDELFELAGQLVAANRELTACLRAECDRVIHLRERNGLLSEQNSELRARARRGR